MNKKSLLFYSLSGLMALAGLAGCEDKLDRPANPAQEGEEITFGATSRENPIVRTIYDDVPTEGEGGKSYYRVTWEPDGKDTIAIYCPEAQGTTLCNYSITPDENDPTKSSAVTKVHADESGLLWGETDIHHFYGFYPASAVTGTENGRIRATIPVLQNPTGWNYKENKAGGHTIYGTANTDYAYMWAYGEHGRYSTQTGQSVGLTFHPWVTILEIKVPGPAEGTMKVSAINVEATEGSQRVLSGDFICDMTPVIENNGREPVYIAVGEQGAVRNMVTISCYDQDKEDYVELSTNDTLVVRAYLLPYDEYIDSRILQVHVSPVNRGVLTRTLKDPQNAGGVIPHKVNTVILPRISDNGYNYWLSSLDPNIYLSELSLPGSWNSMNQGNSNSDFQTGDITAQFNAGVRGFMVGTDARYRRTTGLEGGDYRDGYLRIDGSTPLTTLLSQLHNALVSLDASHKNEFVFLQVSFNGGEGDIYNSGFQGKYSAEEGWLRTVNYQLNQLKNDTQYGLYTYPITPDTKISDVAGKIILKFNTNMTNANMYVTNTELPALFTQYKGGYDQIPMKWGAPINNTEQISELKWFFQEADHIITSGQSSGSEATVSDKRTWINNVFEESIKLYESGSAHDTWFYNCLGGYYTSNNNAVQWTNYISPIVTQYLQARNENASLGLVYMNHVNSDASANILQTIIDNNFKFELRKAGN